MKAKFFLFPFLLLTIVSCSTEVNERNVLDAILDNDSETIHKMFYKKYKKEIGQLDNSP